MGRPVTPVPFRPSTTPLLAPPRRRVRRSIRVAFVAVLVAAAALAAFHFRDDLPSLAAAGGPPAHGYGCLGRSRPGPTSTLPESFALADPEC